MTLSRACHDPLLQCHLSQAPHCRKVTMNRFLPRTLLAAATLLLAAGVHAQDITGAGSSFAAPIYAKWADAYYKATGVKLNYQSIGSGAGLKQIAAKTVDFGASDMPLADADLA